MKSSSLFLLLCLCLTGINLHGQCLYGDAQSNQPTKVKWINGDIYLAATNSDLATSTNTRATFSRFDSQGNLVWSIELDSSSVITDFEATEDNAILLVGRTPMVPLGGGLFTDNRSLIAKVSLNGNLIFCRTINNNGRETFTSIVRHPNPGPGNSPYYILGLQNEGAAFNTYDIVMLYNVNNMGVLSWKYPYNNSVNFDDEYGRKLILLGNGNLMMMGSGNGGIARGYYVEVNTNGVVINGDAQTTFFASFSDGIALPGNEKILAGRLVLGPTAGIARYNAQNNVRWGLRFPNQRDVLAIERDNNNHIFVLGIEIINAIETPVITRITDNGASATVDWTRRFNDGPLNNTSRIAATFDISGDGDMVYVDGRFSSQNIMPMLEDLLVEISDQQLNSCLTQNLTVSSENINPALEDFTTTLLLSGIPESVNHGGDSDWLPQENCVCENCEAQFTITPSPAGCFQYNFTSNSTGVINGYLWSFGDGFSQSNAQNPTYTYPGPGTYVVCLYITNGQCESTVCQTLVVPEIAFCPTFSQVPFNTAGPGIGYCFGLNFTTPPPPISSFSISIDGAIVVGPTSNPILGFCHSFPAAGTYNLCYTATTTDGCTFECCQTIDVLDNNGTFDCQHGDARSNVPTKVKWIDGDIYVAATNSNTSGNVATRATFSRYDGQGNLVWSVELDSFSVITDFELTNNNTILLVGRTPIVSAGGGTFVDNRSLIAGIDLNGALLFCRTINNTGRESFTSIVRHPNPGSLNSPYYILGFENDDPLSFDTYDRVMLFNVDNMGVVNWKRQYRNGFDDEYARKLILLGNGNMLMVGSGHAGHPDGYLVEINTNGTIISDSAQISHFASIADGIALPQNELILAGRLKAPSAGIVRYDALNNVRWGLEFPNQIDLLAVDRDNNGHIFTLGIQTINNIQTPVITRITDNGSFATVDWMRHLNDGSIINNSRVAATFDVLTNGNIVYAEGRRGNQYGLGLEDVFLAVTGPDFGTCFLDSIVPPVFDTITPSLTDFTSALLTPAAPATSPYCLAPAWTPQDSCICRNCEASFTFSPSPTGCFQYAFTNTSSGYNLSYYWDFGDGNTSTVENPIHTYAAAGSYTACLTVTNGSCEDTYCQVIEVDIDNECPTIQVQYQSTAANGSIEFEFTLNFNNPPAVTSNWITIDGVIVVPATPNLIQQFTNVFPQSGTYQVCYHAISSDGCQFECCEEVDIIDPGNVFDCLHGDDRSNVPTKVKWINGDIYVAATNSASSGNVATRATFSRYDGQGNWVWSVELDSNSVITDFELTDNNTILLVGRTPIVSVGGGLFVDNQSLIAGIDLNGNLLFCRTINNTGRESFTSIVRHPNPGSSNSPYYILGYENDVAGVFDTYDRVMLFNVDNMGIVNWKQQYRNGFDDEYARKLILLDNGNLMMMGSGNAGTPRGYYVEIDIDGNIIRDEAERTFFASLADAISLPNNEVILAGRLVNTTAGIARFDALNNLRWSLRFPSQIDLLAIDHDNNGSIYTLGIQNIGGIQTPVITRIIDNGASANVVWMRHLNDGSMNNTTRVAATFDVLGTGNIVYAEGRASNQYGFLLEDLYLALTDPDFTTTCFDTALLVNFNNIIPVIEDFATAALVAATPAPVNYGLAPAWSPQDNCVCENCEALFSFSVSESDCLQYNFSNTSTGYNLTLLWNFGDGATSTAQNPVHTFPGQGTYNVCLTVTNGTCEDTYCQTVTVNCSSCCLDYMAFEEQVAAGFSLQRSECVVYLEAIALDSCKQLVIEWGDGSQEGPVTGSTAVAHVYSGSGNYTICANVSEIGAEGLPCFSKDTCWTVCIVCDTCNTTVWEQDYPAPGWDIFSDLTMGSNGEIYVIGNISSNSMDIDGNILSSIDANGDVVIAKLNPNGNVIGGHVYRFGGNGGIGDRGETIKLAANGDIVIGGRVTGSNIDFAFNGIAANPSVVVGSGQISVTQEHNFIARYNSDFKLLWFDTIRGDKIMDIAFYKADEMIAVGSRYVDFAPSLRQNYIERYVPAGVNNWTRTWTNTHTFGDVGYNDNTWTVETDPVGGIYVCGQFNGEVTLGNDQLGYSGNITSGYIANLDDAGNYKWAFDIPRLFQPTNQGGGVAFAIDIDYPYLFVIGNGSNTLDPTGILVPPTFPDSSGGIYVAKYRVDGDPTQSSGSLEWAFNIPRVGNDFNDIKLDGMGNLFITGQLVGGNIDLDPSIIPNPDALFDAGGNNDQDFFIAKYTDLDNGNVLPTFVCGMQVSTTLPDVSYGMEVYDGNIYIAGALNHDPFPNFIQADPLIGKYNCPCAIEEATCCEDISISEHPISADSTSCCYSFDMQNNVGFDMNHLEINLETPGWAIDLNSILLSGGFVLSSSSASFLGISSATGLLPKGTFNDFLGFCLKRTDPQAAPVQTLIFNWYEAKPDGTTLIACSDSITLNCEATVGTIAPLQSEFRLYPNPTTGKVVLEFEEPLKQAHRIKLLDVTGRQLSTTALPDGQKRFELEFNSLPSGMYLLEITDPNGRSAYRKLVISK
jgi:PKD repeat protein